MGSASEDEESARGKIPDMPQRGNYRQTVAIEGEDDEEEYQLSFLDQPPTYQAATSARPAHTPNTTTVSTEAGFEVAAQSIPIGGRLDEVEEEPDDGYTNNGNQHDNNIDDNNNEEEEEEEGGDDYDDDDDDYADIDDTAALMGGEREQPTQNESPNHRPAAPASSTRNGYHPTAPMMWDDRERNGHWNDLRDQPGCCGGDSGGCCFSSRGGCFFSDRGGCFFSDRDGFCCSDRGGCFYSDTRGCCFSNNGGCFFSDTHGCCFASGGACCCSQAPAGKGNNIRL